MISSINIITHKKIICIWSLSAYFKQFHQIIELPVDVTTNCYWSFNRLNIAFLLEYFFCLLSHKICDGLLYRIKIWLDILSMDDIVLIVLYMRLGWKVHYWYSFFKYIWINKRINITYLICIIKWFEWIRGKCYITILFIFVLYIYGIDI